MADPEIGSTSMAGSGGIRESKCCPKTTLGPLEQHRLFGLQGAHATRLVNGIPSLIKFSQGANKPSSNYYKRIGIQTYSKQMCL